VCRSALPADFRRPRLHRERGVHEVGVINPQRSEQVFEHVMLVRVTADGLYHRAQMGYSTGGAIAITLLAYHPDRFRSVIVGGAGVTPQSPQVLADVAAALEMDDLSAIKNPAALFFRQFAESRANDLHALAALCRVRLGLRLAPEDVEAALGRFGCRCSSWLPTRTGLWLRCKGSARLFPTHSSSSCLGKITSVRSPPKRTRMPWRRF